MNNKYSGNYWDDFKEACEEGKENIAYVLLGKKKKDNKKKYGKHDTIIEMCENILKDGNYEME